MKPRTVALIAAAVVAAHIAVFYWVGGMNPLPKVTYIAPPNFNYGSAKFTDPATGQKMVYQEFTVSSGLEKTDVGASSGASRP